MKTLAIPALLTLGLTVACTSIDDPTELTSDPLPDAPRIAADGAIALMGDRLLVQAQTLDSEQREIRVEVRGAAAWDLTGLDGYVGPLWIAHAPEDGALMLGAEALPTAVFVLDGHDDVVDWESFDTDLYLDADALFFRDDPGPSGRDHQASSALADHGDATAIFECGAGPRTRTISQWACWVEGTEGQGGCTAFCGGNEVACCGHQGTMVNWCYCKPPSPGGDDCVFQGGFCPASCMTCDQQF